MSGNIDTWDNEPSYTSAPVSASTSKPKISKPAPIRDDWDADDDDEGADSPQAIEERNKQLWEDANTKVHRPMPSLVISRGSSSSSSMPSLPLNQPPPMRILKRPSPAISPSQSSANVNSATETFQEREARYQAARERIFGTPIPTEEASEPGDKKKTPSSSSSPKLTPPTSPPLPPSTKIVREPRGPSNSTSPKRDESKKSKGFEDRRDKRPPAPATISSPTSNQLPTSDISVQ